MRTIITPLSFRYTAKNNKGQTIATATKLNTLAETIKAKYPRNTTINRPPIYITGTDGETITVL